MAFQRTHPEAYPKIYKHFLGKRTQNKYWIQDLTEEYFDEVIDGYVNIFLNDEIICKYSRVSEDKVSVEEFRQIWLHCLQEKLSLICLTKSEDGQIKIVGYNCLFASQVDEKDDFEFHGATIKKVLNVLEVLDKKRDIYKELNVDKCIKALGLIVFSDYRGESIGEELLRAREPLCKEINCKMTATAFTSYISQALAKKSGFVDFESVDYDSLGETDAAMKIDGISEHTRACKLMYILYK